MKLRIFLGMRDFNQFKVPEEVPRQSIVSSDLLEMIQLFAQVIVKRDKHRNIRGKEIKNIFNDQCMIFKNLSVICPQKSFHTHTHG